MNCVVQRQLPTFGEIDKCKLSWVQAELPVVRSAAFTAMERKGSRGEWERCMERLAAVLRPGLFQLLGLRCRDVTTSNPDGDVRIVTGVVKGAKLSWPLLSLCWGQPRFA